MDLCIYHGNCADGFGAAWAVRKAIPNISFHAATYQALPPDVTKLRVIIVDFSYKRDVLIAMAAQAESIVILDHHKTAAEDLVDLPDNVTAVFDMERSGARLAWDYFFPEQTMPMLLQHIEDRDLWRFALADTRAVMANVLSQPQHFDLWDELMVRDTELLRLEGLGIERKHRQDIASMLKTMVRRVTICGFNVPCANMPFMYSSDAGGIMAKGEPFAATYWDTETGRTFSLRSTDEGVDVAAIAQVFGGGGHRNAAGFSISHPQLDFSVEPITP